MKGKISVLILLLLLTVTYSQTADPGSWQVGQVPYIETSSKGVITINHQMSLDNNQEYGMCWMRFVYINNNTSPGTTLSRWIMTEPVYADPYSSYSETTPTSYDMGSSYRYSDGKQSYEFSFGIDDNNSWNRVHSTSLLSLCGSENNTLIITFYGSQSDIYNFTGYTPLTLPKDLNSLSEIQSRMNVSYLNKTYICLNTLNNTKEISYIFGFNTRTYFGLIDLGNKNSTWIVNSTNLGIQVTCDVFRQTDFPLYNTRGFGMYGHNFVRYFTPLPPNSIIFPTTYTSLVVITPIELLNIGNNAGLNWVTQALLDVIANYRHFVFSLPEPVPSIVRTLNELTNLGVVIISFILMQKVFQYLLSFRKSIKTSLSKAGMVFSQLMFWLVILVLFFYFMSHMIYLCGMKAAITVYGLGLMGVHFEAPRSITDVPALAWDAFYLGFVGTTISDCTQYYQTADSNSHGTITTDFINLENKNISLLLRADIVLMLLFIIMTILSILWETTSYIRRKVKGMEEDIRRPDVDQTEYEDEM
jgi:hypothetical protein